MRRNDHFPPPFHGRNTGSIPVGRASNFKHLTETAQSGVPVVSRPNSEVRTRTAPHRTLVRRSSQLRRRHTRLHADRSVASTPKDCSRRTDGRGAALHWAQGRANVDNIGQGTRRLSRYCQRALSAIRAWSRPSPPCPTREAGTFPKASAAPKDGDAGLLIAGHTPCRGVYTATLPTGARAVEAFQ
jgi:hypothetical protein